MSLRALFHFCSHLPLLGRCHLLQQTPAAVYLAADSPRNLVAALDGSGQILWRHLQDSKVRQLLVKGQLVAVLTQHNLLLYTVRGELLWRHSIGAGTASVALAEERAGVVLVHEGAVTHFDSFSGAILLNRSAGSFTTSFASFDAAGKVWHAIGAVNGRWAEVSLDNPSSKVEIFDGLTPSHSLLLKVPGWRLGLSASASQFLLVQDKRTQVEAIEFASLLPPSVRGGIGQNPSLHSVDYDPKAGLWLVAVHGGDTKLFGALLRIEVAQHSVKIVHVFESVPQTGNVH